MCNNICMHVVLGPDHKKLLMLTYIASIAIRIMSDTRDEEKDRNKDQGSKVCCKTPKIQEICKTPVRILRLC